MSIRRIISLSAANVAALTALTALTALSLAACQQPQPTPTAASPVTATVTETVTHAPGATSVEKSETETAKPAPGTAASASKELTSFQEEMYQQLLVATQEGDPVTIKGTPATLCVYGDGYALHMVAAGPNTSCDFARELMRQQTAGLNATDDNVRDHLQSTLTVASPVTGGSYDMSCAVDADRLITCSGGNNATVFMY